ncbi:MAG: arylmalonate decarboxylase [Candidatus Entotheonella factor]|uniref:Arylmalonate decarboxylase n=1 Tax=Entotheonella factor TaxID=1429438 RepID=W4LHS7_ENTF1|nr:MAG: arylmalonate decarboxylase [Candidatus Entotheonella factor]
MPDALGWRAKFGVLAPSTNTIVEPDFYHMSVPGVTSHFSRIHIRNQDLGSNAAFEALLEQVREEIRTAVERVMTAEPDYMVMGMSSETFWGGMEGNRQFVKQIQDLTGNMGVATGAEACERVLQHYGIKRIGVVTPYQPVGNHNVELFFNEIGADVVRIKGLRCPTAVSIAHVDEATLRQALLDVDGDDVDALVQAGTNLSMLRLADEAERWLGKPVIAINAAIWWMALRDNGIEDKIDGCGRLLREF